MSQGYSTALYKTICCSLPQVVLTDESSSSLLQVGADQNKVDPATICGTSP